MRLLREEGRESGAWKGLGVCTKASDLNPENREPRRDLRLPRGGTGLLVGKTVVAAECKDGLKEEGLLEEEEFQCVAETTAQHQVERSVVG